MINAIETLFGMAATGIVGGIILHFIKKPEASRRMFVIGIAALGIAVALEIYVRFAEG